MHNLRDYKWIPKLKYVMLERLYFRPATVNCFIFPLYFCEKGNLFPHSNFTSVILSNMHILNEKFNFLKHIRYIRHIYMTLL